MTRRTLTLWLVVIICLINGYHCYHYHGNTIGERISIQRKRLFAAKPVTVSFEPSGKSIISEQGALIAEVAKKAGVSIPFGCRQGRCNSCEVRLNGRGKKVISQ